MSSLKIQQNIPLAPYTTFKIGGPARWFCVVRDQFDALEGYEFAKERHLQTFVLGGGSNVLISDDGFNGLVMRVVNKGIEVVKETADDVLLKVASGEVWDEVVKFAVTNNWWGIENLSHIPGSTGAIAVQNVGAYGQEASNVIESVTVFDKQTHQITNIKNADCGFAYRSSIFNTSNKGKYIIFDIAFRLKKNGQPNLSYRDVRNFFDLPTTPSAPPGAGHLPQKGENNNVLSLSEIRKAITAIRDKKFPFPTEAKKGNAGSFFKNLFLTRDEFQAVKNKVLEALGEEAKTRLEEKVMLSGEQIKVPAAFLIELCGLKNLHSGGAAINPNQPLVIINQTGQATAADVLNLAKLVRDDVESKTGIILQFEPELIGFT